MAKKKSTAAKKPAAGTKGKTRREFLFVQTAKDAELVAQRKQNTYTLTLRGVGGTIYFSDRPVRMAGHEPTQLFADSWKTGPNSFADDPPNAELVLFQPGKAPSAMTLTLLNPHWQKEAPLKISYTVTFVDEKKQRTVDGGSAALFIDPGGKSFSSGDTCQTPGWWHTASGRKSTWRNEQFTKGAEFPYGKNETILTWKIGLV